MESLIFKIITSPKKGEEELDLIKISKNKSLLLSLVLINLIAVSSTIFCSSFNSKVLAVSKPLFEVNTSKKQHDLNQFCKSLTNSKLFVKTELFFGLGKADGSEVSTFEFNQFLSRKITPKFPDGLTLVSGYGQFRSSSNKIIKEPMNLLILIYPFEKTNYSNQEISSIRQSYKREFKQESVLRSDNLSCVSF